MFWSSLADTIKHPVLSRKILEMAPAGARTPRNARSSPVSRSWHVSISCCMSVYISFLIPLVISVSGFTPQKYIFIWRSLSISPNHILYPPSFYTCHLTRRAARRKRAVEQSVQPYASVPLLLHAVMRIQRATIYQKCIIMDSIIIHSTIESTIRTQCTASSL